MPVPCENAKIHEDEVIASELIGYDFTTPKSLISSDNKFSFGFTYSSKITPTDRPEYPIICKKWEFPISTYITDIAFDLDSSVWVATNNGIVYKFSPVSTIDKIFTKDDGIGDKVIRAITIDHFNNVWLATNSGVSRYDGESWIYYTPNDGLPEGYLDDIAISPGGDVWVSSSEGYAKYEISQDKWFVFRPDDYIGALPSYSITWTKDGSVWFTGSNSLIQLINPDNVTGKSYWIIHKSGYSDTNIPLKEISDSSLAPDGSIWFSGKNEEGPVIANYSPLMDKWKTYSYLTTNQAMIGDVILVTASSPDGSVWLGTRDSGLMHLISSQMSSDDTWVVYTKHNGLPYEGIHHVAVENESTIWIGYETSLSRCKINK